MKKIISLLLVLVLSLSLVACGGGAAEAPKADAPTSDVTLVYWSMWEATEPQGVVIGEAIRLSLLRPASKSMFSSRAVRASVRACSPLWTPAPTSTCSTKALTAF